MRPSGGPCFVVLSSAGDLCAGYLCAVSDFPRNQLRMELGKTWVACYQVKKLCTGFSHGLLALSLM
jgi:hypothetical protein